MKVWGSHTTGSSAHMTERVLALTYSFPPTAVPESTLSVKRLGNLPFEVDVISLAPFRAWMGDDHSLDDYIEARFGSIQRVEAPPIRRRLPLGRLGPLTRCPDQFRLFDNLIYRAARERISSYDYLVTWSQWHSIHLVGRRLARQPDAPLWAAHLSDPWSRNPYSNNGKMLRALNETLERRVLNDADLLLFPAEETAARVIEVEPSAGKKAHVLPHSFDPKLYGSRPTPDSGDRILMRYVGHFYGPRSPEPLFRGLELLNSSDPDVGRRVVVEIVGNVPHHMLRALEQLPEGQVSIVPPVDYRTSLALMCSADILLVVDAPAESSPFLPSKLIDYLGAHRPIVAISPSGPAAKLTAEYGGWVADPSDHGAIAEALRAACEAASTTPDADFGDELVRSRYEAGRVSDAMANALRGARAS